MESFSPRTSRFAFIRSLFSHVGTLPPGDKAVVLLLASLFILLLLAGLYTLERQFLVEVPSYGGSLTEGVVGTPRFVHPLLALSDADRDLSLLTYAGLMGYGSDGALVPVLAESYEVSPDGTVYTFRLREHAEFSDGSPITAEDVVFTVEKAQDPGLKSPELANWANIRAESIDARTVRFTLPNAYAPFLADATLGILPAHLWKTVKNEEFPFSSLATKPVGAGPFIASRIERDDTGAITRYELLANKHYALGRPYLDALRFAYFKDEEALQQALLSGRVESAYGLPIPEGLTGKTFIEVPYSRIFGVFWNAGRNPLYAKLEVRKALSVATDRDALVREVLGGYGTGAYGPVPPGSIPNPVHPETPEDRIAEAAEILEDAGWKYDAEARLWKQAKAGLELSVSLTTSNVPELKAIAEHLRSDWAALGVPVALELFEPGDLASSAIRPRTYDALLFGMTIGREHDLFAFWDSSERSDPGLNIALYASRAVDALLEEIREEPDRAVRDAKLAELDALIAGDYPAVFTHAPDFLYIVPRELSGIALTEIASPSDRFIGADRWYRRTEFVWPWLSPNGVARE